MTEKIEWYKEVLELEPNSKVFFPLARLLAGENRSDEAVAALEHGLGRHPEFLEARLFLIELLFTNGRSAACADQVNKLGALFSGYTGFWQAWAACLSSTGGSSGTALALRFLAATFLNGSVTLQDALERGLTSLLATPATPTAGVQPHEQILQPHVMQPPVLAAHVASAASESAFHVAAHPDCEPLLPIADDDNAMHDEAAQAGIAHSAAALDAPAVSAIVGADLADVAGPDGDDAPLATMSDDDLESISSGAFGAFGAQTDDNEDVEERFSLRTRSMAEVLAEQGDIRGALDIYHELVAAAVNAEEGADLRQRISTLTTRLNAASEGQEQAPQSESPISKDKLISMLEALAERVEARAQS